MDKDIYYASFIRLIVVPLATLIVLKAINIDPFIKNIIVILQALSVATITAVIVEINKGDAEFASKLVVISHILFIVTIPIIAFFL